MVYYLALRHITSEKCVRIPHLPRHLAVKIIVPAGGRKPLEYFWTLKPVTMDGRIDMRLL